MPEQKPEPDRTDAPPKRERPEPRNQEPGRGEAPKGATRLPRKGDELDDLHGTPTD